MTEKCKEMNVPNTGRSVTSHQCWKNATRDGFCGIHHPDAVKRREAKATAAAKIWHEKWTRRGFDERAGDRCRELGISPEEIKA